MEVKVKNKKRSHKLQDFFQQSGSGQTEELKSNNSTYITLEEYKKLKKDKIQNLNSKPQGYVHHTVTSSKPEDLNALEKLTVSAMPKKRNPDQLKLQKKASKTKMTEINMLKKIEHEFYSKEESKINEGGVSSSNNSGVKKNTSTLFFSSFRKRYLCSYIASFMDNKDLFHFCYLTKMLKNHLKISIQLFYRMYMEETLEHKLSGMATLDDVFEYDCMAIKNTNLFKICKNKLELFLAKYELGRYIFFKYIANKPELVNENGDVKSLIFKFDRKFNNTENKYDYTFRSLKDFGLEVLSFCLSFCNGIETLVLDGCQLAKINTVRYFTFFFDKVRNLTIRNMEIDLISLKILVEYFEDAEELENLNLDCISRFLDMNILAEGLSMIPNLVSLSLDNNFLKDDDLFVLLKHAANMPSLNYLSVRDNFILSDSDDFKSRLREALKKTSIKEVILEKEKKEDQDD